MNVPSALEKTRAIDPTWVDGVMAALRAIPTSQRKTFTWATTSTPALDLGLRSRPASVLVLNAVSAADPATSYSGLPCSWTWGRDGLLTIASVTGLSAGVSYSLTVLVVEASNG